MSLANIKFSWRQKKKTKKKKDFADTKLQRRFKIRTICKN